MFTFSLSFSPPLPITLPQSLSLVLFSRFLCCLPSPRTLPWVHFKFLKLPSSENNSLVEVWNSVLLQTTLNT